LNADRVGSVFWLVVGLLSAWGALGLGFGNWHEPGSGFLPFLAAVFVSLMAFIVLLQSFLRGGAPGKKISSLWQNVHWQRPVAICALLLAYLLLFERLGFLLTNFFLLFFLLKKVEKLSWGKAIAYPVLTIGISYLLFQVFLKTTLPKGFLGF
jgi:putative tricarboxylic transport membrane protein